MSSQDAQSRPLQSAARETTSGISLIVREHDGIERHNEPVVIGVPLAAGYAPKSSCWRLSDASGSNIICQTRAMACWPDGSIKWLSCIFEASVEAGQTTEYQLVAYTRDSSASAPADRQRILVDATPDRIAIRTSSCQFQLAKGNTGLITEGCADGQPLIDHAGVCLSLTEASGRTLEARIDTLASQEAGSVRATAILTGSFGPRCRLTFRALLSFFAHSNAVHVALTLQNSGRARHAGGYWDLGDPGSVLFRSLTLKIRQPDTTGKQSVSWTVSPRATVNRTTDPDWEIYQDSSGGDSWQSRNHVNRNGKIPLSFQGYRVRHGREESSGPRASPTVYMESEAGAIGLAPLDFWQKFPAAIASREGEIHWQPFPAQFSDLHELQAGEHSTRVAWLDFAPASADPCQRLAWVHAPLEARCAPRDYAESGAVPYLPDEKTALRPELKSMLAEALEGPRNFFVKREIVDEYGWRNYGDTWADHEEAYYTGPQKPLISHYNNQFDILQGMLVEYLRSGDRRWWDLADPLARHVMDIDIYHTDRDKSAYNGGLFWPTTHYYDAGTSTHRSMAREMSETGNRGNGGGPGSEHNFTSGLLLYYYLTGDERARETVIGLADWVIAMDDGEQHLLSLLSGKPTGAATLTSAPGYDGPGRGAANSIMALSDGYWATGNEKYLDKADEIIRRTIHPCDVIAQRQLDDAELRWSYTMYLQSLLRYLEIGAVLPGRFGISQYVTHSLLHYARWMVEYEQFTLDHPEKLEFPTETWAAQELRKGVVLLMAARLAEPDERQTFQQRGMYFLDRAWETLLSFPTRAYTRPLALVLTQGYIEAALRDSTAPLPHISIADVPFEPGEPMVFDSQKEDIRCALKSPPRLVRMFTRSVSPVRWRSLIRRSWLAERIRTVFHRGGRPT